MKSLRNYGISGLSFASNSLILFCFLCFAAYAAVFGGDVSIEYNKPINISINSIILFNFINIRYQKKQID